MRGDIITLTRKQGNIMNNFISKNFYNSDEMDKSFEKQLTESDIKRNGKSEKPNIYLKCQIYNNNNDNDDNE